jgi:ketosteroid isomerase-like protein
MWKARSATIITIGLIMSLSCGSSYDLADELKTLIEYERDFARTSIDKGIRDSFLAFLDDESIVFRPHPVNGVESTEKSKPSAASLQWAPVYADIAVSGDLGYTTGPWEYRAKGIDDTVVIHGNYISIWKKQADGGWKVILDTGISNPDPSLALSEIKTKSGLKFADPENPGEDNGKARQKLMDFDRRGSEYCESNGTLDFYDKNCTDDIRFFRDKITPMTGKGQVVDYLSDNPGRFTWNPIDAFISGQSDFAYSYGLSKFEAEVEGDTEAQYGYYLRIWRRNDDGDWKIALDVISPSPPPQNDIT